MEFTGRATFEWRKEGRKHIGLYLDGAKLGCVYPADNGRYKAFVLTVVHRDSRHRTLDEAKAALLTALGIVVEWETPQGEVEP